MTDILIVERGSGGDAVLNTNDLATVNGYENAPYLSMFGGSDWWGNYLLQVDKFLSKTEDLLKITVLNSAGRIAIERAINSDLSFLSKIPGTTWTATTKITNANRLEITITINGKQFNLVWNPDSSFLTYKIT